MLKFVKQKPALFYLALLAFAFSLCSSLQLANLSSIFRFLGASTSNLPWLWLTPPLTGIIIQPLIGQMSDDTVTRYGKRRPYIIFWSLLAAFTCIVLPFLSSLMVAVFFTLLINCSLNGGTEALRALTGDLLNQDIDRSRAFSIQAFFAGIGGALGAGLPYIIYKIAQYTNIDIPNAVHRFPFNLKISFVISGIILFVLTLITMKAVHEKTYKHIGLLTSKRKPYSFARRSFKTMKDLYYSIKKMPPRFKIICIIHSISWAGIFIFWLYFTTALAQNLYGMKDNHYNILQRATLDSSFYLSIYQYVSILYSALLYFVSTNHKRNIFIHSASLLIGGIAIMLLPFEHTPLAIEAAMVAYGIMWGSIMVLPYAIAIQFLPRGKLGIYLGIFNICITAPQILCSLLLSSIYYYVLNENASYLIAMGGGLIVISSYLWMRVFNLEGSAVLRNMKQLLSFKTT